jgi:hypothetical protein
VRLNTHTHKQQCICTKCAEEGKYKKGYVKPLPKAVEEKKQHLEEQWEEVKGMCRSLELHRNTVSACGVGKHICISLITHAVHTQLGYFCRVILFNFFHYTQLFLYLFSDVRLSAGACRVQVNDMCKRMHNQINETNARLMKDIVTAEQV